MGQPAMTNCKSMKAWPASTAHSGGKTAEDGHRWSPNLRAPLVDRPGFSRCRWDAEHLEKLAFKQACRRDKRGWEM
ncbi:hypothetical protein FOMG_17770 [Fusarium oxysporum f. sp. melonis 26406]|uniref:Uncharacterized protein n=1 Tax=Fusarium oxysporum f. sp. melonis 26406 TaxID=1089452 RepID=W9ZAG6_FUSOX|nr:hypothetical protein FOMG_17770 [Fusarium oxysporum f. sp. melonis 26406]